MRFQTFFSPYMFSFDFPHHITAEVKLNEKSIILLLLMPNVTTLSFSTPFPYSLSLYLVTLLLKLYLAFQARSKKYILRNEKKKFLAYGSFWTLEDVDAFTEGKSGAQECFRALLPVEIKVCEASTADELILMLSKYFPDLALWLPTTSTF